MNTFTNQIPAIFKIETASGPMQIKATSYIDARREARRLDKEFWMDYLAH